jgi:hypothetical protein
MITGNSRNKETDSFKTLAHKPGMISDLHSDEARTPNFSTLLGILEE